MSDRVFSFVAEEDGDDGWCSVVQTGIRQVQACHRVTRYDELRSKRAQGGCVAATAKTSSDLSEKGWPDEKSELVLLVMH